MEVENTAIIKIKMPSYLSEILECEDNITFLHSKVSPNPEEDELPESIKNASVSDSELEVTGNPLILDDLKIDDNSNLSLLGTIASQPNNWPDSENYFYPVDISTARNLMNQLLLSGKEMDSAGLYCVCNGKDSKKTLLLGANPRLNYRLITTILNNVEIEKLPLEYMKNKHIRNCEYQNNASVKVTATYNLVGYNLKHVDGKKCNINSSVVLKAAWNKLVYEPLIDNITTTKLMLQLIPGHHESMFYSLQKELFLIEKYLNIPTSDIDENLEISIEPLAISDIKENLLNMLTKSTLKKPETEKNNVNFKSLNLKDLREEDLLDKLWHLLNNCENLKEVSLCLTLMFEEFAENPGIPFKILDTNTSSIALLIKGIREGKLAVPTISPEQALMFFIEMGINKLKNDYLYIIKNTDVVEYHKILDQWNEFNIKSIDTRKTISAGKILNFRRTRQTVHKDSSLLNTSVLRKELNYLESIHIMIEFLSNLHKTSLSEDAKEEVSKEIFKKYAPLKNSEKLHNLRETPFCEMSVNLSKITTDLFKSFKPTSWRIELESIKYKHSIKSIFYQSENPVIPTVVYNGYDIKSDTKSSLFALETLVISSIS